MNDSEVIMDTKKAKGTRLHKYSPIFTLIVIVRQLIIPLIFGSFYYKHSYYGEQMVTIATVFFTLFPLLTYWFYHYWVLEDKIEVKEGILFKKNRKIPYTRIQNVNVSQGPLQRILKVATLQLESASGGKPEAVMRVVSLNVVEEIKSKVKAASSTHYSKDNTTNETAKDQETEHHLLRLPINEVIKYGIITQKGLFFGAMLFGILAQNQKLVTYAFDFIRKFYQFPDISSITYAAGAVYISIIALIIFSVLQLLSIIWALLKFYDFNIEKHNDRLQASMGLISKVASTIPLKRIQLYRISENPIHKYFKAKTITIETAGGVNTDKQGIIMRWIAPYIQSKKVNIFIRNIEPKIKLGSLDWRLIPQRAWKRVFKRSLFIIGLTSIPFIILKIPYGLLLLLLIPIAYLYSKRFVLNTAYYIDNDIISFKSGVWFGKQSFVRISKIQTIEIQQSYFDRRNNMATLEIDTAGSNVLLHHVKIPYLELNEVYRLRDLINNRLNKTEFNW